LDRCELSKQRVGYSRLVKRAKYAVQATACQFYPTNGHSHSIMSEDEPGDFGWVGSDQGPKQVLRAMGPRSTRPPARSSPRLAIDAPYALRNFLRLCDFLD